MFANGKGMYSETYLQWNLNETETFSVRKFLWSHGKRVKTNVRLFVLNRTVWCGNCGGGGT
jgi:hypothetical protein